MNEVDTVVLPGEAIAVAADETTVYCAVAGRLLGFEGDGTPTLDVPAPDGIGSLAGAGGILTAVLEPGIVAWLDPRTAEIRAQIPVGGDPEIMAGGGSVWVLDRRTDRTWRLTGEGTLDGPIAVPGVDRLSPEGDRAWWTSRHDTLLREGDRAVDLGVGPGERGGIVACAGSVWVSVPGSLVRVGVWAGAPGPPMPAPEGPVELLACSDGVLVGGSGRHGLFVLDPSIDADVRHLDVDVGGVLQHLVAAGSVAAAFPAGRAEARLVPIRPRG